VTQTLLFFFLSCSIS